jgi:hypothetical protein
VPRADRDGRAVIDSNGSGTTTTDQLGALLYELLDAHIDTIKLAGPLDENQHWAAHLDYLRGLQRVGREALARLGQAA